MEQKILKKKCQYCKKEISSMYEKQLDYNLKAHELTCKKNPEVIKEKMEREERMKTTCRSFGHSYNRQGICKDCGRKREKKK